MGKSSEYSPSVGPGLQMPGTPWMLISSSSSGPLVWGRRESCCESARIPGTDLLGGDLAARQGKRGRGCWPWAPSSGQKQENLLQSRVSVSRSGVPDPSRLHGLRPTRLLCPWDFPGKDTGVGCHFLLQGIFPTQGSNPCLLNCRQILCRLSYKGK